MIPIACRRAHLIVSVVPSDLYPTIPHTETNARDFTVTFLDQQELMLVNGAEKLPVWDYPFYECEGKGSSHILCTDLSIRK